MISTGAFEGTATATRKADRTFVTETDLAIEQRVRERIERVFPDHAIVGEEHGAREGTGAVRWYIDPIDGTHNFMRRIPIFATLLAVESGGVLEAAVVSAPALRRRWQAVRGSGAHVSVDGSPPKRIEVSRVASIEDAQMLYSSAGSLMRDARVPGFRGLIDRSWRERGFGDFWGYMLVAEGAAEAMIEKGIQPYDLAAPALIVEEAGGVVTDFAGRSDRSGDSVLAANRVLHGELLRTLRTPPVEPRPARAASAAVWSASGKAKRRS